MIAIKNNVGYILMLFLLYISCLYPLSLAKADE